MTLSAMIDLETLSTRPDAAIVSIGVVKFDQNGVHDSAGWAFDMSKVTGHIDPMTVSWWMAQSDFAREYSFKGNADPHHVAIELRNFLQGTDEAWANDPEFDLVILKSWWQSLVPKIGPWPIHYRASRSFRTIMAEAKACGILLADAQGTAHNPIDDAANQARAVIAARAGLRAGREVPL